MNTQHTPGPWRVDEEERKGSGVGITYRYVRADAALGQVATVYGPRADAYLISAAPDLLAALRDVTASLEAALERDEIKGKYRIEPTRRASVARAAIAKAEGV